LWLTWQAKTAGPPGVTMQDKYSLAKCEQYGRRLASRLCQQYFGPQPDATLDGPALLQFTPVRQLNLLVLRQLLGRWQHEAQQLRSPFFNFEAEPVRTALTQFMNVLSRHIRLDRAALEPLLAQAATDTLVLAADPVLAFERVVLPTTGPDADEPVAVAQLRDGLRYFDQDKEFYQNFVESLPKGNAPLSRDFLTQRFALYQAKHYKGVDTMPRLVAAFSALLPLADADLRDDAPAAPIPSPTPAVPVSAPAAPPVPPSTPAVPAVVPPKLVVAEPALTTPQPAAPAPTPIPAVESPVQPSSVPLYEKLKATQPTTPHVAEALRHAVQGGPTPLAERSAPKVGSLREAISINQRFSFINELFNGENTEYHAAIQHLDELPTAEAATTYVRQELGQQYDWSRKEEHVGRLLKLIERKFATA
jgi:hypothetical protein